MNAFSRVRGHCSRILEESSAESKGDCGDTAQGISERDDGKSWEGDHSCDTVAKDVSTSFPCPKNIPKAKAAKF